MRSLTNSVNKNIDGFVRLCFIDALKEFGGRRFIIDEMEIAVFKIEGKIYALSNICPHQHTTMIYEGFIEHGCVVCPVHGWMFDLQTGNTPAGRKGLDSYETKIVDNVVYVKILKKELTW